MDRSGIEEFLSGLSYPLYFLDFETFNPAIPLYDHNRPYQQIPFQYSIHYKENRDGELRHDEFLALPISDPCQAFIEQLVTKTEGVGDILTYNQNFEKTRLKELARDFPEYAAALMDRISRIKDLMPPFQQRLYYAHNMNGGYSIKDVLPALVPELRYDDLSINNGGDASLSFEQMIYEPTADHSAVRSNLLAYCGLDTLAICNGEDIGKAGEDCCLALLSQDIMVLWNLHSCPLNIIIMIYCESRSSIGHCQITIPVQECLRRNMSILMDGKWRVTGTRIERGILVGQVIAHK